MADPARIVTSESRLRRILLRLLAPERVVEVLDELREHPPESTEKPTDRDKATAERYLRRSGTR